MNRYLITLLLLLVTATAQGATILASPFPNLSTAFTSTSTLSKMVEVDKPLPINSKTITGRGIKPSMGGKMRYSGHVHIEGPVEDAQFQWLEPVGSGYVTFGTMLGASSLLEKSAQVTCAPPVWWGAVAGSTNPTVMAKNVLAFTAALKTRLPLCAGPGTYYINDEINAGTGYVFNGEIYGAGKYNTVIYQTDSSKNIFNFPSVYSVHVHDVTLYGGYNGLILQTNNQDMSQLAIDNVVIRNQTNRGIIAPIGSTSAELNITDSTFVGDSTFVESYTDYTTITNSWAEITGAVPAFINHFQLTVTGLTGVSTTSSTAACWIRSYGNVVIENNRFGADLGTGRTIVENHNGSWESFIYAENNFMATTDYIYKLHALPQHFTSKANTGFGSLGGGQKGIWIDTAASTSYALVGNYDIQDQALEYSQGTGNSGSKQVLVQSKTDHPTAPTTIQFADVLVSKPASNIWSVLNTPSANVTLTNPNYPPSGGTLSGVAITATADNAHGETYATTNFGITVGDLATMALDCYVTGATSPITVYLTFQGQRKYFTLMNGLNILSMPYQQLTSGNADYYINTQSMPNGSAVIFSRLRVFKGYKNVTTMNTVYFDLSSNLPPDLTAQQGYHYEGDIVYYLNPVAAQHAGRICTETTATGVWNQFGAIVDVPFP